MTDAADRYLAGLARLDPKAAQALGETPGVVVPRLCPEVFAARRGNVVPRRHIRAAAQCESWVDRSRRGAGSAPCATRRCPAATCSTAAFEVDRYPGRPGQVLSFTVGARSGGFLTG